MTLVKTSLLNGIAVVIKMLTLLGLNKLLAMYVGPSGYAAIGQFQNAIQMVSTIASGSINTGVTKYTAEYQRNEDQQQNVWRTASTIALVTSIFSSVLVAIFSKQLASWFLKDEIYSGVFLWFAITLTFFVFNSLLLAILNGKKEIKKYVVINIAGSIVSLIVTSVLVIYFGLSGALVAIATNQSITLLVTIALVYRAPWVKWIYFFGRIDLNIARKLAKFTVMALVSALSIPTSHILVRNHLGETLGWEAAGYWEAMWRLSAAYLMLVTTTLSVYYLPKLSELKDATEIRSEIVQGYKLILPVAAFCALVIYEFRDFIITTLFTIEFTPMRELFAWQMIGDTLKIGSWILGYLFIAKAMMLVFVVSEIFFSATFFLLVYFLQPLYGIESTAIAHAINYFFYFLFVFIVLRKKRVI